MGIQSQMDWDNRIGAIGAGATAVGGLMVGVGVSGALPSLGVGLGVAGLGALIMGAGIGMVYVAAERLDQKADQNSSKGTRVEVGDTGPDGKDAGTVITVPTVTIEDTPTDEKKKGEKYPPPDDYYPSPDDPDGTYPNPEGTGGGGPRSVGLREVTADVLHGPGLATLVVPTGARTLRVSGVFAKMAEDGTPLRYGTAMMMV